MKQLFCDVCRREVADPIPGRSFFFQAQYDLCEDCRDDLEKAMKYTVRTKKPFDSGWYDSLVLDTIKAGIARKKIEAKSGR